MISPKRRRKTNRNGVKRKVTAPEEYQPNVCRGDNANPRGAGLIISYGQKLDLSKVSKDFSFHVRNNNQIIIKSKVVFPL